MATTSDISRGNFIRYNGEVCQIVEWIHRTPGKGRAYYQAGMKNVRTGKSAENRYRSGETIDVVRVEVQNMQFLYKNGDRLVLMNSETFDQMEMDGSVLGNALLLLKEGTEMEVGFDDAEPLFARPPKVVELEVTYTEPGIKGDTANKAMKPATMETGAEVSVPLFVNQGEKIRIDTETGSYMERAK